MIFGIGTDLVIIDRIAKVFNKFGDKFSQRILSANESEQFESNKNKITFLAKRFAAKEAFSKALGTGIRGFSFQDIEIHHTELGRPNIRAHGKCLAVLNENKITKIHLSVSDEVDLAQAFVVIEF